MQVPILNGIYTDNTGEYRTSYPRNMVPVPKTTGISKGYLKPADGIVQFATGPGVDRGAINWNGTMYRVMGTKLCQIESTGLIFICGDVGGGSDPVSFDYSFDRLAISSDGKFYYWDGAALTQVTDSDLGIVIDFIWVDGYFMTTDGRFLVVTDLADPYAVNPLKYGTAETDPDPIKGIVKIRNEPYAVGRYTIEVFENIGGTLFPFQRIEGAQIQRGTLGTYSFCAMAFNTYLGIAFLGSGRNESPSVWFGINGTSTKLATREIDIILQNYTEAELSSAFVESRVDKTHSFLLIHLPDQTLVYDAGASETVGEPVWFHLDSGLVEPSTYRARSLVWVYDKWIFGDITSNKLGYYVNNISSQYDTRIGWNFGTLIIYNASRNAIFHELELIGLPGNVAFGIDPTIWTSFSTDGETWSVERSRSAGKQGARQTRLNWLQMGTLMNSAIRIQKFRGTSDSHMSIAALEARLEALA